jgi:predicted Zn-dependent peptidase
MARFQKESLKMKERTPEFFILPNGLRIVHLPVKSEVAHVGITVMAGSRFEEENKVGLAHFLEHCIFKGTKKRRAFHILSRLDAVGGELNAFTGKEEMCIYASFTKPYLNRSLELLSDIIKNSVFPDKEIQKEKDIVIDEINSYMDNPSEHIFDEFEAQIFTNHPLGNNILGTKHSVESFQQADLIRFTEKFFFPENMVMSVVGPYSMKRIIEAALRYFADLDRKGTIPALKPFEGYKPSKRRECFSNYQSHVVLGGLAYNIHHEKRLTMAFLTNILGGPALNSRLSLAIREKHGMAYSVEANYSPFLDCGYHSIYLGTDEKWVEKSIELIHKELNKLKNIPLGKIQFSMFKEQLKGHLALASESNVNLMIALGKSVLIHDKIETTRELFSKVDAITTTEIQDIAHEVYDVDQMSALIFVPERD